MGNATIDLNEQGRVADEKLKALGLCLTQGGEPTFVPHDTSAPEWNVAALGNEKLLHARRLARELATTLYPGAVMLQSFGKQYPAEPLPRWQLGLFRSRSGAPLWNDWQRLRVEQTGIPPATGETARLFLQGLITSLKLDAATVPVFEDFEAHLRAQKDSEKDRMIPRFCRRRKAFEGRDLNGEDLTAHAAYFEPAGWILPLDHDEDGWKTERWEWPADEDIQLVPGDSPVGLRLPLSRLPEDALRRTLTVECKRGELLLFLPPVASAAAFCELVRLVEQVAARMDLPPLRLEGYAPGRDPDLETIALTSDPGVLEVNLPPADNWPEFQRVVKGLFSAAEASGLRGDKYQLSGRRIASGGGAHIILGGPDLEDNPFLKRPHLLASILRFVQNHPSLSYAFTGLYTGPSSQAPRVDEGAPELPYELEITLAAMEQMKGPGPAFLIDAMLRNLLMDWNGNTHRAEISVDKFYNQDSPNGRLGLVEFRAFEMLPTAEMLLSTNVLLRALAATFAETPYVAPLIDWGTALHDRFALPGFLRQDLADVAAFLNRHGFSFAPEWFDAHLDFRFPIIHEFQVGATTWTLRHAIEPWPVMGDHSGTGRIVDATTDRLELSVADKDAAARFVATVNGRRLPLHPLGDTGAVSGVRYRLFDNPWGLQPQVQAHSPLIFQIIDPETNHVVHAFDYLNWKRDGGNYDGLPESAGEARDRVAQRLVNREDSIGTKADWRETPPSSLAPFTLDLRRG
ncbi:MAG: transglutaminase family protein [Verrucomicrobia bacterium]|nr:transglutaminase family protein [Verrucomicrobiota bacterium]